MGSTRWKGLERVGTAGRWCAGNAVGAILAVVLLGWFVQAQETPRHAEPVRRIYVATFQGKFGAAQLRQGVIDRLRTSGKVELVNRAADADAVVQGNGELWVEGYQRISPHAGAGMRQAVYDGYLSVEVRNRNGETLWSYLVTPGRMHWRGVDENMADHMVRLMLPALAAAGATSARPETASNSQITLAGAGSTFAAPLYQEWLQSFANRQPEVHATYQAVGSEQGMRLLEDGKVDFAGSDVAISDDQIATLPVKFSQIATALGGVVPAYNLPGVGSWLRFTPDILADIYLGRITRWNDSRLRALNHGVSLPDEPIVVLHRSDGSGTSFAWTDFLSRTSPAWKAAVGTGMSVNWQTGAAVAGNEGVAEKVAATPGAIGYMELTYAIRHDLSFGLVRNAAGKFVAANLTTLSAAARTAPRAGDLRASLVNATGTNAYPIATLTWILFPASAGNPQKRAALADLVRWMLTSGQKECSGLGYLPLPREIVDDELRHVGPTVALASSEKDLHTVTDGDDSTASYVAHMAHF